jgi:TonB-linked SusC/RagA family outer membrane protein
MVKTIRRIFVLLLGVLSTAGAVSAQGTLKGTVTDKTTGEPLPTANVFLTEIRRGATTDFDGNYSITGVPAGSYTLRVTYVGYKQLNTTIEIASAEVVFDVKLDADLVGLEELVVTGYGSQIKEKQTGNVSSVSGATISGVPVPTFEQALQGRLSGVQITAGNGKVGQGLQIRIRGSASVNASNEPLYVVDGVPVIATSDALTAPVNPLSDLNFNDIESISVLKDASAAAIYGSRASNGVVVITTKKGKAGATRININMSRGASTPTGKRGFLNSEEYVQGYIQAGKNSDRVFNRSDKFYENFVRSRLTRYSGGNSNWSVWQYDDPYYVADTAGLTAINADWQDEAFQRGVQSNLDFNISGGADKTKFYLSGSMADQEGILIQNRLLRYSGRLNIDHEASKYLTTGMNLTFSRNENFRVPNDNAFSTPLQLVAQPPIQPVYDEETGLLAGHPDAAFTRTLYYNGLLDRDYSTFTMEAYRTLGNAYAVLTPMEKLSIRGELGVDLRTQYEQRWWGSPTARNTGLALGGGQSRWVQDLAYNSKLFATYADQVKNDHNVKVIAGMEFYQLERRRTDAQAQDFATDDFKNTANAALVTVGNGDRTLSNFYSVYTRVEYDYKGKYLFSSSGRTDGSSRFGESNRFGYFPSYSAGWILTRESFLAGNESLSFLKLRGSWGLTGNAEIGNFNYQGLYGSSNYNGVPGISHTQFANPDLKWETTEQTNIGVDFGLFKDRLTGEFDYYVKRTSDLLLNVNVPATTGFATQLRNVGNLENKGVELVLNSYNMVGEFEWKTTFNIARNRNKITDLAGNVILGGTMNQAREGQPIGVFYTVEFAGANPANGDAVFYVNAPNENDVDFLAAVAAGDIFKVDGRFGDRYITADYSLTNRVVVGDPNPDYVGGIANSFKYKGFDLDVLFQFVRGNDIYNGGGLFMSASYDWFDNQTSDQKNSWTPENTNTNVPEARFLGGNGTQESSRWIEDGSFVRLKTVTFGYNASRKFAQRLGFNTLRVYATGQNLITWTKYTGWDPEVNADHLATNIGLGNDFYSAPQARTLLMGLNIGF